MMRKKRIAIADLLASFPPKGGACVDLLMTFTRLADEFDIKIFTARWGSEMARAEFSPGMPLDYEICNPAENSRESIVASITEKIDAWQPDLVFIADGWTLKPYLASALNKKYPCILRLYAYEMLCPRNNERWVFDRQCENHALADSQKCLECASAYAQIVREKKNGASNPLIEEAEAANIYDGSYEKNVRDSLKCSAVIVYNGMTASIIKNCTDSSVYVVPGGVDTDIFKKPASKKTGNKPFRIAVCGRMDDSAKGAESVIEAGKILAEKGVDFTMAITRRKSVVSYPWLNETGWLSRDDMIHLLSVSDCAVVPSLWQEAFGMTWLEAMAMGLPVIASRTAGPLEHITDAENALLYPPGDAAALADSLSRLIDDPVFSGKLAENGYRLATKFSWDNAAGMTRSVINDILRG